MKSFYLPIRTRYVETAQDGIIHHSSYVIYYETARIEYFKAKGFDINAMEQEGILCPVVSIDAHYLRPLRSLEDIDIRVSIHSASKVRFSILHEIFRFQEKIAYAITSHCFINKSFKPIPIPSALLKSFLNEMQSIIAEV